MKRMVICLTIAAVIIAVGVYALFAVSDRNARLYGKVEAVLSAYDSGGDVEGEIENLEKFFDSEYVPKLGPVVDDDLLAEISAAISRLRPMYLSGCDEFSAECETVRAGAEKIYFNEFPRAYRIL